MLQRSLSYVHLIRPMNRIYFPSFNNLNPTINQTIRTIYQNTNSHKQHYFNNKSIQSYSSRLFNNCPLQYFQQNKFPHSRNFSILTLFSTAKSSNETIQTVTQSSDATSSAVTTATTDVIVHSSLYSDHSFLIRYAAELLDTMHTSLGMPWWLTIATVSIGTRLLMFPFTIKQQRASAALQAMKPAMKELDAKWQKKLQEEATVQTMQAHRQAQRELRREYGASTGAALAPLLLNIPLFITLLATINAINKVTPPGWKEGGLLWFTDFSVADPLFILPVVNSVALIAAVQLGGDSGDSSSKMMKNIFSVTGLLLLPYLLFQSAGIVWYWLVATGFSALQTILLRKPAVRQFFKLPALPVNQNDPLANIKKLFNLTAKNVSTQAAIPEKPTTIVSNKVPAAPYIRPQTTSQRKPLSNTMKSSKQLAGNKRSFSVMSSRGNFYYKNF